MSNMFCQALALMCSSTVLLYTIEQATERGHVKVDDAVNNTIADMSNRTVCTDKL